VILTIEEYRLLNPNDTESDSALEFKLQALESAIRAYTNNNFQKRSFRFTCQILDGKLLFNTNLIKQGDTVQISDSVYNDGVFTVVKADSSNITLSEILEDEPYCMVTKIVYPPDVKAGVASMLKWDSENRDKIGVSSETLSRHSVTYADMSGDNSLMGYPVALLGFLKPYMKARF
jgi:hypothetical protein